MADADALVVAGPEPSPSTSTSTPATTAAAPTYSAVSAPGRMSTSGATHTFYGWQNIAVGGAGASGLLGLGLLASLDGGGGGGDEGLGLAGAVAGLTYLLGGLIVHSVHGHWEKGLGAAAILLATPATGALIGWGASAGCEGLDCRANGAVWGAVTGMMAAPLIDGLSLGWERKGGTAAGPSNVAAAPTILPSVTPLREGGVVLTLGGPI